MIRKLAFMVIWSVALWLAFASIAIAVNNPDIPLSTLLGKVFTFDWLRFK